MKELNNEAYEDITTQDNPTPQTAGQAQESQRLSNSPQAASQPVQSPGEPVQTSNNAGASISAPQAKTIDNMSLSELQTEKTNRENTLKEKQSAVNAVNNESNEKLNLQKLQQTKLKQNMKRLLKKMMVQRNLLNKY